MGNIIAKSKRDWSPLLVLFLAVLGLTALSLMSHGELDLLNLFVIPVLFSLFLLLWFWGYYRVVITDEDVVIKEYRIFKRKKECYRYAQLDGYYDVEEVYKKKDGTNFVVERLERFFFLRTNMPQRYEKSASHPNHPNHNLQLTDNQCAKFLFTKIDEVRKYSWMLSMRNFMTLCILSHPEKQNYIGGDGL